MTTDLETSGVAARSVEVDDITTRDEPRRRRSAPLEMSGAEFRRFGHALVDRIAGFLEQIPETPIVPQKAPSQIQSRVLGIDFPEHGVPTEALLSEACELLFGNSLLIGHPRFWGFITSSAAPLGALADLLAAAVNPNMAAWGGGPIATEIELQTVAWISRLIGYREPCAGLFVGGGTAANAVGVLAARAAALGPEGRTRGLFKRLTMYGSVHTHAWLEKVADQHGFGSDAVRLVETDAEHRISVPALRARIEADIAAGYSPLLVVGNAGTIHTGAVDPLAELHEVCRRHGIWFHIDGAYGAFAASSEHAPDDLRHLELADSVAVDPHKWLYAPLEAGCILVKDKAALLAAFSSRPSYYNIKEDQPDELTHFFELGPQNSRNFKALKVWMALRSVGASGYRRMISEDIRLAARLHDRVASHPHLEAFSHSLSITCFRFRPRGEQAADPAYVDRVNEALLEQLQRRGDFFLSNAVVDDRFYLRACVVNFRTDVSDIEALPEYVAQLGHEVEASLS